MLSDIEEHKLNSIFEKRFKELAFADKIKIKTWSSYLENIGCKKWHPWDTNFFSESVEIINDPSPFGGYLILATEIAKKILVLGLP